MVRGHPREVVFQHGQGAGQCHVAAAAEQGHAGEAEDGGHQRGVGHPAQTLDAALEASCRGRQRERRYDAGCGVTRCYGSKEMLYAVSKQRQHFSPSGAPSG